MAKPRKQANRKKSAIFSTRMDANLKRQIQKSAGLHSRGNLSAEMDRLLKTALATEKQQDKSIRAISYLLGQIALTVSAVLGPDEQKTWRNDPWLYQAFLHGASHLLARLGPEGELVPPTSWLDPTVPAENLGAIAETHVWSLLLSAERPSSAGFDVPQGYWLYAMPQARDDLGIKSKNNQLIAELLQKGDKS